MSNRLIPDVGSEPDTGKEGQLLALGCLRRQAVLGFLSLDQNQWLGKRVPSFGGSFGFGTWFFSLWSWAPVLAVLARGQVPAPLVAAPTLILGWVSGIKFGRGFCFNLRWSAYAVNCMGSALLALTLEKGTVSSGSSQKRGWCCILAYLIKYVYRVILLGKTVTEVRIVSSFCKVMFIISWAYVKRRGGWGLYGVQRGLWHLQLLRVSLLPAFSDMPLPYFLEGRPRALHRFPPLWPLIEPWGQISICISPCRSQNVSPGRRVLPLHSQWLTFNEHLLGPHAIEAPFLSPQPEVAPILYSVCRGETWDRGESTTTGTQMLVPSSMPLLPGQWWS